MISKTNDDHNRLARATSNIFDYSAQEVVKQEHLTYLDLLKSQGTEPDHTYLMQAFSVTEKHAGIILSHWQDSVSDYGIGDIDANESLDKQP